MRYTGIWEDQRQAQGQGEEGKISLSPLFVIPLSIRAGGRLCGPRPLPTAPTTIIFLHVQVKYIFCLTSATFSCFFISPQILYLCYCHVRARSSPSLPSGASHRVCCRNHLICRLWSARSRDDPSRREHKSSRWGMTSLIESGTPPWRSALSRQTAAASWRCRFFTSKRNYLCGGEKMSNLWAYRHPARPPPPFLLVCTKSLISIAERFVSAWKPSTEFHLGFDVESRRGNWGSWKARRE